MKTRARAACKSSRFWSRFRNRNPEKTCRTRARFLVLICVADWGMAVSIIALIRDSSESMALSLLSRSGLLIEPSKKASITRSRLACRAARRALEASASTPATPEGCWRPATYISAICAIAFLLWMRRLKTSTTFGSTLDARMYGLRQP
jgi:hypothetical protein